MATTTSTNAKATVVIASGPRGCQRRRSQGMALARPRIDAAPTTAVVPSILASNDPIRPMTRQ